MSGHEHADKTNIDRPQLGVGSLGKRFVIEVIVLHVFLFWMLLWSRLAQLHLARGDTTKAVVTVALFIPPALWMLIRHVADRSGRKLPRARQLITPSG